MHASYAKNSTGENPIILVKVTNEAGAVSKYSVTIHDIDPANASDLEMFALCSYADDQGMGMGETKGSWEALQSYKNQSAANGTATASLTLEDFASLRQDCTAIITIMVDQAITNGDYRQVLDGKHILTMFQDCTSEKILQRKLHIRIKI